MKSKYDHGENDNSGTKAELKIIPNAGHTLPLEQPEKANADVKAFLDMMSV